MPVVHASRLGLALLAVLLPASVGGQPLDKGGWDRPPVREMDLAIRTEGPSILSVGQSARFVLTVVNQGPGSVDAGDVRISDTLPSGFGAPVQAGGAGWTCQAAGRTVTCLYRGGPVAAARALPPIILTARAVAPGPFVQCATVASTRLGDPRPDDNRACVRGEVRAPVVRRDLRLRKAGPAALLVGQTATFTLTTHNLGAAAIGAADGVTVTDTLPVNFAQVQATGAGWTCTISGGSPAVISCVYVGPSVAPGAPLPVLRVSAVARTDGAFVNCAKIAGRIGLDATPGDNRGCMEGRVRREGESFDVGVLKRLGGPMVTGQTVSFVLAPYNTGGASAAAASGVRVTDALPANFANVQATGADWTCAVTGVAPSTVSCGYVGPAVAANSPFPPITVSAIARTGGPFVNCADIAFRAARDLNPRDNRSCVDGTVTAPATEARPDVNLSKTAIDGPWRWPGGTGRYEFKIGNTGDTAIPAGSTFRLTETLPAGMVLSQAPGAWNCTPGVGTAGPAPLTCTYLSTAALNPGAWMVFSLEVGFQGAWRTAYENCAEVRVDRGGRPWAEADLTNNRACTPVTVGGSWPFDVGIRKRGPSSLVPGQLATYVLTPFNAASQSLDLNPPPANPPPFVSVFQAVVEVVDVLPAGFATPVTASGTSWNCAVSGRTVTCDYAGGGIIPSGASLPPITISAKARTPGAADQCATVSIGGAFFVVDPAQADNRSCVPLTIGQPSS